MSDLVGKGTESLFKMHITKTSKIKSKKPNQKATLVIKKWSNEGINWSVNKRNVGKRDKHGRYGKEEKYSRTWLTPCEGDRRVKDPKNNETR